MVCGCSDRHECGECKGSARLAGGEHNHRKTHLDTQISLSSSRSSIPSFYESAKQIRVHYLHSLTMSSKYSVHDTSQAASARVFWSLSMHENCAGQNLLDNEILWLTSILSRANAPSVLNPVSSLDTNAWDALRSDTIRHY